MVKVFSKALNKTLEVDRVIGKIEGSQPGPTIIFTAGIHGNEPSGIFALHKVLKNLKNKKENIQGTIYGISGNLNALKKGVRYTHQDLNRLWTENQIQKLRKGKLKTKNDDIAEQIELYHTISKILKIESSPFYFMDLHTTSSKTTPFLTVNDSLLNRFFTKQYPIPVVLGIEEYLEGPLLSYINELGYVAFGFEAGQHDDLSSIEHQIAFIYLTLYFSECIKERDKTFQYYYQILAKTSVDFHNIYEIYFHYKIKKGEKFTMKPGFLNFQKIYKGQELAKSNTGIISAEKSGRILMPQYQSKGDDGFFSIRKIPQIFLSLSKTLRILKFDHILPFFPGIQWKTNKRDTLLVNKKISWVFAKQFFYLLGYRSRQINDQHFIIKNREDASRNRDYKDFLWYNK